MTNPDNIVRVRARNGGRASVYEANGWCQAYGSGILDGTGVVQNTSANMTVLVGGSSSKPDVLIAENPSGYKIALDLVGQQPVTITAPASNSRISAIVAYTDDLALESTEDTVTGSPASCGLIVVNGSSSASPSAPTDTQIRNAITSDGATGSQASYAVIATITVASNTTTITDSLITRNQAGVQSSKIDFATSTDANGWAEMDCGSFKIYLKNGLTSVTVGGNSWRGEVVSSKPVNLSLDGVFSGVCSGQADDNAITSNGRINVGNGDVYFTLVNHFAQSITTSTRWSAIIIEFIAS